jgi:hypothetical protein
MTQYAESPRFISDVMLGSLARWLRILGFDTIYFRAITDNELIKIARQQERILLTRDTGIARRKQVQQLILIHSNDTLEQLKEVLSALRIMNRSKRLFPGSDVPKLSPRCPVCNGELTATERKAVADDIPEYVFLNATSFFTCRECGKVYWCGSHKKSIDSILKQVIDDR